MGAGPGRVATAGPATTDIKSRPGHGMNRSRSGSKPTPRAKSTIRWVGSATLRFRIVALSALVLALPGVSLGASSRLGPPSSSGPTSVSIGFFLSDVNAVSEEEETFEFEGILTLEWRDPRQAFDPVEAGMPTKIYQGAYQFAEIYDGWWPQLILANESGQFESQGVLLRIESDGLLTLIQEVDAVAEMPMELRRFPFDRQRFEAIFEVLGFGQDQVVLVPDPGTTGRKGQGVNIAQWDLHEIGVSTREYDPVYEDGHVGALSQLVVTLDMARRPGHTLRVVVVPLALLVFLTFSIFWMDRESLSDRMDISFIGILALAAYQIVTNESMPRIAYFTLMNSFLLSTYLLLSAGVVINLVVSKLDQAGRSATGDRIDRICRWAFPLLFISMNALSAVYFVLFH